MPEPEKLIPPHGGYRRLKSFQVAQLVYDVTVRFCERYIDKRSRTHDQMVQAARSGVQNIAEGSQASGTSKKFELKLTSVARASLEELRLDYEDFLRQRGLTEWPRDDRRRTALVARRCATAEDVAAWVGEVYGQGNGLAAGKGNGRDGRNGPDGLKAKGAARSAVGEAPKTGPASKAAPPPKAAGPSKQSISSIKSIPSIVHQKPSYSEIAANAALVLIGVACSLLDRQIAAQEKSFETEGGFTERLYRVRTQRRTQR